MATPQLSKLIQITELSDRIQKLQVRVDSLNAEIEAKMKRAVEEEKAEIQKLVIEAKVIENIEKFKQDIIELSKEEDVIREQVEKQAEEDLNRFYSNGGFTGFVSRVLQAKSTSDSQVVASEDMKQYLSGVSVNETVSNQGTLKLVNGNIIFDFSDLREHLKEALIVHYISR